MTRVLLISTYDLGRQPFGLASPAAWLRAAGASVACLDLAVEPLDEGVVRAADAIAFHLPMHTATRLAGAVISRIRALNPRARLAGYGLYAVPNERWLRGLGAEAVFGGEFERALTDWALGLAATGAAGGARAPAAADGASANGRRGGRGADRASPAISLERLAFITPDRSGLPDLSRYARLDPGDGEPVTVGYTEASRGCKHLCRHCPVVPVYGGRFRIVPRAVVLEDVRRQVAAGARHVTFGDPDFWNGIGHALPLVRALHAEFPRVTYDATIKIEHLLEHAEHLTTLRETGCRFVTSAVESTDDRVLEILEKGHTRADFVAVARRFRAEGLVLHPTFVAFTPWTTPSSYLDLLALVAELDLIEHVAPVQLAIRLLVPAGSRLLELADLRGRVEPFDDARLCHPWRHSDPRVDRLAERVGDAVREGLARGDARAAIFQRAFDLAARAADRPRRLARAARSPRRPPVPFLTEPWYC
jgi:radical SAM superfamily enzyme YgiQ (UPF0313 family)